MIRAILSRLFRISIYSSPKIAPAFRPRVDRLEKRELLAGQVLLPGTTTRTPSQQFVAQCYEDVLQRPADAPGLAFWSGLVDRGVPHEQIALALEKSPEGAGRTVRDLYGDLLGRDADPRGLSAFTDFVARGGTVERAKALILGSPEYFQARGGATNSGFLAALFADVLRRPIDPSASASYGARLSRGEDRTRIAAEVIASPEGRERVVKDMYVEMLRRDAEPGGLAFHADELAGAGTAQTVLANILGSAECSQRPTLHPGNVITDWNSVLLDAIRADKTPPPKASRALAMVQVAMADAVYALSGLGTFYHATPAVPSGASREAAAAAAAQRVLASLFPAQAAAFDAALAHSLALVPGGQAQDRGAAFGRAVGDGILALRANDGSATAVPYTPGTGPGVWQPTAPANAAALLPQWPNVTPFVMTSGSQFRPAAPPVLTSQQYTDAFNEVKALGSATNSTRTADQTLIAAFWADGAGTFTPPGHWNQVAQDAAAQRGGTLTEDARLLATLDVAEADAAIVSWDAKFTDNFWRPVTAIRAADTDGNPDTAPDAAWAPLLVTPPFPGYISGHSTFSGAADVVLTNFFGSVPFTTRSDDSTNIIRSFPNFSEAANEAGQSRIYGGIHFQFDNQAGLASGRGLGQLVAGKYLS